jgi:hypothetical protein
MVRRVLGVLCLGITVLFMSSCGQTYKLLSISVTPGTLTPSGDSQVELVGIGAFQQLTVTATFSNTKTQVVTVDPNTKYELGSSLMPSNLNPSVAVPLQNVVVSNSGMVSVLSAACTYDTEPISSADSSWTYFTYPYKLKVTYTNNGVTATAIMDVNVLNTRYCFDGTNATPFAGFAGNLSAGWGA